MNISSHLYDSSTKFKKFSPLSSIHRRGSNLAVPSFKSYLRWLRRNNKNINGKPSFRKQDAVTQAGAKKVGHNMQVYSKSAQGRHGRNESARTDAVRTGLNSGMV
jgi:hypothetical protein